MYLNQLICPTWLTCDSSSPSLEISNAVGLARASSELPGSPKEIELVRGMPLALIKLSGSASPSLDAKQGAAIQEAFKEQR